MFSDLAQLAQLPLLLLLLTRNNRPGQLVPYTCKVYIYVYSRVKYMCSINNRPARLTDGADDPGGPRDAYLRRVVVDLRPELLTLSVDKEEGGPIRRDNFPRPGEHDPGASQ